MNESFPPEFLALMREVYAQFTVETVLPATVEIAELVADCSDFALEQLAQSRIKSVSMAALVEGWQRGLDPITLNDN